MKQQRLRPQKPSKLALSNAGKLSCLASEYKIFISSLSPSSNKTFLCQRSHKQSMKHLSLQQIENHLVEGTVNAALSYVAQAFRSNNRPDPRLDVDNKICFILQEQFRAYRNEDGSRRKQKALPMMVLRKMTDLSSSKLEIATSWLLIGAIFFAMQSCEYLRTALEETKRTKIVRLKNITFKKDNKILKHNSTLLEKVDLVRIRFCFQKNDKRDVCVHMFKSGDNLLCPVVAWAKTIKRVKRIQGSSEESEVCLFQGSTGQTSLIRSEYV